MNFCFDSLFPRKSPPGRGGCTDGFSLALVRIAAFVVVMTALPGVAQTGDREAAARSVLIAALHGAQATDAVATNPTATNRFAVAAPVSATAVGNPFNLLDDKYRVAIGDQLSFQILEDEEDPKILVVTDSGDLQAPYIGRYPAAGKTCKELSLALKLELEKEYYRQATVIIAVDSKPKSRGKVYLVGAIQKPGPEDITGDEELTLTKAILRAGSFTDVADQKNVRITRSPGGSGTETNFTVNVARVFEKGRTKDDLVLQPGDLIFVPDRMVRF